MRRPHEGMVDCGLGCWVPSGNASGATLVRARRCRGDVFPLAITMQLLEIDLKQIGVPTCQGS